MRYFHSIQVLRFLAASLVFFAHLGIGGHGYKGIDILFVISGFVIYLISYKKSGSGFVAAIRFLKRRLIRIFAFYWLLFLGLIIFGVYTVNFDWSFLKSLFLLPGHQSFLLVTWSLSYELYFYAIFFLIFVFLNPSKARVFLISFWLLTFVFLLLQWTDFSVKGTRWNFLLGQNIWFILSGCLACMFYLNMEKWPSPKRTIVSALFLITGVFLFFCYVAYYSTLSFLLTGTGSCLILLGAINLEILKKQKIPTVLVRLGNASYVAYLIHIPVFNCFAKYNNLQQWHQFIIMGGVWMLSIGIHEWIEKPLLGHLNKY